MSMLLYTPVHTHTQPHPLFLSFSLSEGITTLIRSGALGSICCLPHPRPTKRTRARHLTQVRLLVCCVLICFVCHLFSPMPTTSHTSTSFLCAPCAIECVTLPFRVARTTPKGIPSYHTRAPGFARSYASPHSSCSKAT